MGYYVLKKSDKSVPQPWYFLLKADNHETIATSEMYSSKDAAKKGHRLGAEKRCQRGH